MKAKPRPSSKDWDDKARAYIDDGFQPLKELAERLQQAIEVVDHLPSKVLDPDEDIG